MYYLSTRNQQLKKTLSQAICSGLAGDGGLYIPEHLPTTTVNEFSEDMSLPLLAEKILAPFFKDDILANHLSSICHNAFDFPLPIKELTDKTYMLELFHGPTSSFKDFGAQFLAECLNKLTDKNKRTVMVATSGDTGSAVASAFYNKDNLDVIILYPKGKISARQEQQITCWQDNVLSLAINGTFDDCQRLIKTAFQDEKWNENFSLTTSNSINIGRLLPQIVYYAYSSLQLYKKNEDKPGFIVPSGNFGNATAAFWAKTMGFPIREIAVATNANKVIPDYLASGVFRARPSTATLANAMDVGNPSNFERLQNLFPTVEELRDNMSIISVSDPQIKDTIKDIYDKHHIIICPHTATACYADQQLSNKLWVIASTADPSKFEAVIEPIIEKAVPISPQLIKLLQRPAKIRDLEPDLEQLRVVAQDYFAD